MALMSMTGFADRTGEADGLGWRWEARSVNGRGLELRLRLPEGAETLEPALRLTFGAVLSRGNVTIGLRLGRGEAARASRLNAPALAAVLESAAAVEAAAEERGLALAPMNAADILSLRGVLETEPDAAGSLPPGLVERLAGEVQPLAEALAEARRGEGAALGLVLLGQLDTMARLAAAAREAAETRAARNGTLLRQRVEALMAAAGGLEEGRLAQELALLAVRSDVAEEIDRLEAHIATARELVEKGGVVGRRLDFLMQEFNREANTLASKAQSSELTALALEMKVVIDQMREQVQNVE